MQSNFTPSPSQNSIPVFVGSRVIGQVCGDVFKKSINFSTHALRTPPAIAFDVSTLDDAEKMGARLVEVTDRESGRVYRASLAFIHQNGVTMNRGAGLQIYLPLAYWSIDGQPPRNTPTKAKSNQPAILQPKLF